MDFKYKNYRIRRVHRQLEHLTEYLGVQPDTGHSVLIKVNEKDVEGRDFVHYEYDFIKKYPLDCLLTPVELDSNNQRTVAVYFFPKASTIKQLAKKRNITLEEKYDLCLKILHGMAQLNARHIMLRILNSNNLMVTADGEVKFCDLTAALSEENESLLAWGFRIPESHYPYMSPEQTGRIKKTSDYRSDFYSLGICLFELFTGDIPYICTNILDGLLKNRRVLKFNIKLTINAKIWT
ncbi:MAG: protein kinase [Pseudobacteriovorax sp.]|nr:protein kinase [Pseudobacteriovorax sp.]